MEEDFEIDVNAIAEMASQNAGGIKASTVVEPTPIVTKPHAVVAGRSRSGELVNCLSNKRVTVQYIPQVGTVSDRKHVMYGGLAEGASITLTVPRLRSGIFKNVLTDAEKDYLEYIMGMEPGALNVYNKTNNFWDNTTEGGVSKVRLTKQDTILDLSSPIDYIKYKILLANTDLVAPSQQVLQDKRKLTYKFVLITENDTNEVAKKKMNYKIDSYIEYGKISEDADTLRVVIETLTSKPLASNTKLDFLQTKAGELIENNAKLFLQTIKDPYLKARVLIKKCVEQGFISKRGDYYYLRSDNTPLCEGGEDPVLSNAAKYLSNPKRQEMKFSLEAKLNQE